MKSIVIYDTVYGNTEKIAAAIKENIPGAIMAKANETGKLELSSFDLVIVGSPTQGGRPLKSVQNFLARIPAGKLQESRVAAFDTRTEVSGFLKFVVRLLGYAAPRILKQLKNKGGRAVSTPEGFLVSGKEGPIISGEIDRAAGWASSISKLA